MLIATYWSGIQDYCHAVLSVVIYTTFKQILSLKMEKTPLLRKKSAGWFKSPHLEHLAPIFCFILPLFSSVSSSSLSSSFYSSLPLLLTHRFLVNPFPVFSFTHPLLSLKPFRPPKSLQLRQIFLPLCSCSPRPFPPTHTDSPPLTTPPPVFSGDCICVSEAFFLLAWFWLAFSSGFKEY